MISIDAKEWIVKYGPGNDQRGSIKEGIKLSILIARELAKFHTVKGRAHGDLQLASIKIQRSEGEQGSTKITLLDQTPSTKSTDDVSTAGKKHFVAPEMNSQSKPSTASDVYSFGMIMFSLVSRTLPEKFLKFEFPGQTGKVEVCSKSDRGLEELVLEVIKKCREKDPKNRTEVKELVKKLEELEKHAVKSSSESSAGKEGKGDESVKKAKEGGKRSSSENVKKSSKKATRSKAVESDKQEKPEKRTKQKEGGSEIGDEDEVANNVLGAFDKAKKKMVEHLKKRMKAFEEDVQESMESLRTGVIVPLSQTEPSEEGKGLARVKAELKKMKENELKMAATVKKLEEEKKRARAKVSSLSNDMKRSHSKVQELLIRLDRKEADVKRLKKDNYLLKKREAETAKSLQVQTKKLKNKKMEIGKLNKAVKSAKDDVKAEEAKVKELEIEIKCFKSIEGEAQKLNETCTLLKTQLKNREKVVQELKKKNEALQVNDSKVREFKRAEDALKSTQGMLKKKEQQIKALVKKNKRFQEKEKEMRGLKESSFLMKKQLVEARKKVKDQEKMIEDQVKTKKMLREAWSKARQLEEEMGMKNRMILRMEEIEELNLGLLNEFYGKRKETKVQTLRNMAFHFAWGLEEWFIDRRKSREIYQLLLERDEPINGLGHWTIGTLLRSGFGVEKKDEAKAKKHFREAAKFLKEKESAKTLTTNERIILGSMYLEGHGIRKKEKRGMKMLMKAEGDSNSKNIPALANWRIGAHYFHKLQQGKVSDDPGTIFMKSRQYLEIASNCNFPNALVDLGMLYLWGIRNKMQLQLLSKAITHFKDAAEMGEIEAIFVLGNCHRDGVEVEQSLEEAKVYFERAVEMGHVESKQALLQLESMKSESEADSVIFLKNLKDGNKKDKETGK